MRVKDVKLTQEMSRCLLEERGWYANVDGYHSPRPLLVPWNETYEHGLFPVKNYTSSDPAIPRTFYTRDEPDFYESTLTGTPDELLHYGRLLQLLGAVSVREVEPLTANTGLEPVEVDNARVGDGDEARSSEKFAVKLPGRLRIDHNGKTIEQETTRFIDLECVLRAAIQHSSMPLTYTAGSPPRSAVVVSRPRFLSGRLGVCASTPRRDG